MKIQTTLNALRTLLLGAGTLGITALGTAAVAPTALQAQEPVKVVATLPVYASLVEAIAGDRADVSSIADPNEDSHFVRPKPSFALELRRADLFISLHFNSSFPKLDPRGIETYALTPRGLPSTVVRSGKDDVNVAHAGNAQDAFNLRLATSVHRSLIESLGATDRGVKRARFMTVLQGQKRPAILVEGGYLSDPMEARLIGSSRYRQQLAEGVAKAF